MEIGKQIPSGFFIEIDKFQFFNLIFVFQLEEKPPTDESTWNVKKAEGNVEFGNDELITTKGNLYVL